MTQNHNSKLRFVIIAIAIIFINVFVFILLTSNPYIRSDAWIELQHFLIGFWETGSFSLEDLYRIRSSTHHAQPFHRLLLAGNAVLFGLDFRVEAIFASLFTFGIVILFFKHLFKVFPQTLTSWKTVVVLAALGASVINLNTTTTFLWSLVTLGYIPIFFIILFYIHLSKRLVQHQPPNWLTVFLLCSLLFIADDSGVIAVISAILITCIWSFLQRTPKVLIYPSMLVVVLCLYIFWRNYFILASGTPVGSKSSVLKGIEYLFANPNEWFSAITIPFADSVVHKLHLKKVFSDHAPLVSGLLGLCVLGVHFCCWYLYIKYKIYKKTLLPALLLLFSYGLILGIVLYRIPTIASGAEYLHQPRYGRTFQIGLWGCGLIAACLMIGSTPKPKWRTAVITALSIGFLVLQLYFTRSAWRSSQFIVNHHEKRAEQVLYFAGIAETESPCTVKSKSKFCSFKEEKKELLVEFLQENELNFFNPRLLKKHRMMYKE